MHGAEDALGARRPPVSVTARHVTVAMKVATHIALDDGHAAENLRAWLRAKASRINDVLDEPLAITEVAVLRVPDHAAPASLGNDERRLR
jgi:hypothetical protein